MGTIGRGDVVPSTLSSKKSIAVSSSLSFTSPQWLQLRGGAVERAIEPPDDEGTTEQVFEEI